MTEEKKPWRAEMPPRHLGRVHSLELTCHQCDVEDLVVRANSELDAERAALSKIAELMGCIPDDRYDLIEAVRLMVEESKEKGARIAELEPLLVYASFGGKTGKELAKERDAALARTRSPR